MFTVVWGLISFRNEILIGKKREGPHPYGLGGKWHIIGGRVEKNESEEEALKREIREETGLKIQNIRKLSERIFKNLKGEKVKLVVFYCEVGNKNAKAMSDLEEVKWVKKEKLLEEVCKRVRDDLISMENVMKFLKGRITF